MDVERRGSFTIPPASVSLTQAHRQNSAETYTLENILTLIRKQQPEWGQGGRQGSVQGQHGMPAVFASPSEELGSIPTYVTLGKTFL